VKTYRRIEITAFRRRVTIVSGSFATNNTQPNNEVRITDADTQHAIAPESAEGRRILYEALRLLEDKLAEKQK
jgi:hypothetical protein